MTSELDREEVMYTAALLTAWRFVYYRGGSF